MKNYLRSLVLCSLLLLAPAFALAADASATAAQRADDARIAALIAGDKAAFAATLSDELRYSHSSGSVDTKTSYLATLTQGKPKYASVNYEERTFTTIAPGVVLMSGRGRFNSTPQTGLHLSFLAVWRLEGSTWRFLSWQSCNLDAVAPGAAAAKKP